MAYKLNAQEPCQKMLAALVVRVSRMEAHHAEQEKLAMQR